MHQASQQRLGLSGGAQLQQQRRPHPMLISSLLSLPISPLLKLRWHLSSRIQATSARATRIVGIITALTPPTHRLSSSHATCWWRERQQSSSGQRIRKGLSSSGNKLGRTLRSINDPYTESRRDGCIARLCWEDRTLQVIYNSGDRNGAVLRVLHELARRIDNYGVFVSAEARVMGHYCWPGCREGNRGCSRGDSWQQG